MNPILFEHAADRTFFRKLLCRRGESLASYAHLFDFRDPRLKRAEFNRMRTRVHRLLEKQHGATCQLRLSPRCTGAGLTVDHLIPLSSNKLNKEIRRVPAAPGRKVEAQSFGSNQLANLVLACGPCNGVKKHRILDRDVIQAVLLRMAKP